MLAISLVAIRFDRQCSDQSGLQHQPVRTLYPDRRAAKTRTGIPGNAGVVASVQVLTKNTSTARW